MASPYKIPKKKHPGSDSRHMQSPLSRLQSPAPDFKKFESHKSDRMKAGTLLGSSVNGRNLPRRPLFQTVVKTLLGLKSPARGAAVANRSATGGWNRQSQAGQNTDSSLTNLSNRWRPKRASDRLLHLDASEQAAPPQKKWSTCGDAVPPDQKVSVEAADSLDALRADGSLERLSSSSSWRRSQSWKCDKRDSSVSLKPPKKTLSDTEGESASPPRVRQASVASVAARPSSRPAGGRRRSLADAETRRETWQAFRDGKIISRAAVLRKSQSQSEPIVLSSEEDEEDDGDSSQTGNATQPVGLCPPEGDGSDDLPLPPSFLELDFLSLHAGLIQADANGRMMITPNGIILPLKGVEEGEVTVVASQVRGYGLWDGGRARGGTLLAGRSGPPPSLLFLWVTDAQADLLQRELTAIQTTSASGPSCCVLLLVLREPLQELHAALLASIFEMEEFTKERGSAPPLDWSGGLLLVRDCPPPLDLHLLDLLGQSEERSGPLRRSGRTQGRAPSQQLPSRLIQFPPPPSKGRITVTREDLACLDAGQFLNDVIIDFYLKFLLLKGVSQATAERSHVFSSFFYRQLSRRRAAGEDASSSVPDRQMRHRRVKTWTRNVDIFNKDFVFVPVNQEAHWFLVVVCFPGLLDVQMEPRTCAGETEGSVGKRGVPLRSTAPPECTQLGCKRRIVTKRPCILVMDSLTMSKHDNVCRLLRDYLQVEWQVRRGKRRVFSPEGFHSCSCRVPQQDNSSDCGLFLLQYVESFLQNPVVHFDLPPKLESWFPRQVVRQKREEIRRLIMRLHESQQATRTPR